MNRLRPTGDSDDSDDLDLDDDLSFEDEDEEDEDCDEDDDGDEWSREDQVNAGATESPSDYYFKATAAPDSLIAPIMILITPKQYFDTEGCQWDGHVSVDCGGPLNLPDYEELAEGMFAPVDETATIASVEKDLKSRGFMFNNNLC